MTQPTNKQEALGQIDALRAYIEDLDKPKRVRVYIKQSAMNEITTNSYTEMSKLVGGVFDFRCKGSGMSRARTGVYNADRSDSWFFLDKDCIVVEGELPPNDTKE